MKTIQNKVTTIEKPTPNEAGGIDLTNYADLMTLVMKAVRPEGYSIGEMKRCFTIIDKIENADGEINLEDDEFEYFKSGMNMFRWNRAHKDLIQFEDDINAIK